MTCFEHLVCAVAQGLLSGETDASYFSDEKAFAACVMRHAEALEAELSRRDEERRRQREEGGP